MLLKQAPYIKGIKPMYPLHQLKPLLLLLPHAVKFMILMTGSLKGVKHGRIGRRLKRKGEPIQPLQFKLNLTTQPLEVMLGAPIQPL